MVIASMVQVQDCNSGKMGADAELTTDVASGGANHIPTDIFCFLATG